MFENFSATTFTLVAKYFAAGSVCCALLLSGCRQTPPPDEAKLRISKTADSKLTLAEQASRYYPPESQDLFHAMDGKVIDSEFEELELSEAEVVGRNAWMIWTGGNEAFWDWLARNGYGTLDLLKVLDDRGRSRQFAEGGFITEPGMRPPTAEETKAAKGIRFARPIVADYRSYADYLKRENSASYGNTTLYESLMGISGYGKSAGSNDSDRDGVSSTNAVGDREGDGTEALEINRNQDVAYESVKTNEVGETEGPYGNYTPPNPYIYGFSSGIVGLRLFPNPEFVGAAANRFAADRYYTDADYANDPRTIRPFRVGMACSFCHVGPHPLNPPENVEFPKWENLSGTIGAQYLRVRKSFGSELDKSNYFYHVLDSQFPGTIDTSLIASDNINNANSMNAIFGLGWRVRRALHNSPEQLSPQSAVYPGLWEGPYPKEILPKDLYLARDQFEESIRPRAIPRVLIDGSDGIGSWVALARVYLNIGSYHQRWIQQHNTVLGFRPQQPFTLAECEENSVYWHATKLRVDPMTAFFLKSTDPMKLWDAPDRKSGEPKWNWEVVLGEGMSEKNASVDSQTKAPQSPNAEAKADSVLAISENASNSEPPADFQGDPWDAPMKQGRQVFAKGCIACHSSIQPGNSLALEQRILHEDLPAAADRSRLQLSIDDLWELTDGSGMLPPLYEIWAKQAVEDEGFWNENYLSTDNRLPITMIGTNSARAMATNAIHDNIWEDFSSLTYKELDSVGQIEFRDPFSQARKSYAASGGGPGYYRVPSLISAWSTAPFFHNNALGDFNNDPSVDGRIKAYHDAMDKLLWPQRRVQTGHDRAALSERERVTNDQARLDSGLVWRTNAPSNLLIRGHQVPSLTGGLLGVSPFVANSLLPWAIPVFLFALGLLMLAGRTIRDWFERLESKFPKIHSAVWPIRFLISAGLLIAAALIGVLVWKYRDALALVETSSEWSFPWLQVQAFIPSVVLILVAFLLIIDGFSFRSTVDRLTNLFGILTLALSLFVAVGAGRALAGHGGDIKIGPFPKGMPVNLVANLDPKASPKKVAKAIKALTRYLGDWHQSPPNQTIGLAEFERDVAPLMQEVSKCPDLVLDRGHEYEFIQHLTDTEKRQLIELVKTF